MSGLVITIPIIQHVINAIVSKETEITPRKIVELLGESYDEDSDYIFEIKDNFLYFKDPDGFEMKFSDLDETTRKQFLNEQREQLV